MSGFQITITDAGRAALINAQNTGTAAFVLSQIGVSTQAIAGDLANLAVLPNERKRLATMAGDVVADDTLHVTIRDESADAYALRSFGLYASTGVLFAVYSQADPILEKSAAAMLLLAVDARLVALGTANVEFGPVGFTLPPASETVAGVVEIATDAEVDAGQDPWRVITARTLKRALGALSNFALKDHKHDAADVETGTFHANRVPELPMSRIAGLIATLADKASALHSHTMAQVSGLIDALATKATLGERVRFASIDMGTGNAIVYSETGDRIGVRTGTPADPRFFRFDSDGNFRALSGGVFSRYGRVWDPENFNPDTKASLGANASFRDLSAARNATDGAVMFGSDGSRWLAYTNGRFELTGLGGLTVNGHRAWTAEHFDPARVVPLRPGHGINSPDNCPEGISGGDANLGVGLRGYAFLTHHRLEGGYSAQLALPDTGEEVFVRRRSQGVWQAWHQIHTSASFNPADKAPALHSHSWEQVTGKPNLATTDGSGVNFGSWSLGLAVQVNGSDWRYLPTAQHVDTIIDWRVATNAETLAGALTHKFVSPAALWSFAKSIGPNGYQQIPGTDLIIQWGVSNGSHPEGAIHSALPVAFGGGCLFACATPRNAGQAYGMDFVMQIVGRYLDRIVFYANRANSSSGNMSGYEWMAVGLARGNPDPVYSSGSFPPGGGGGGGEIIP
ncbi:hypothetical protein JIX58_03430 [Brevundimonas diminuta]|uniref:gp53-like domain-containing protein n=1 Tax=Brevundimonas diminuta TaxID=293 RepID=UPI0019084919|nr:hypothetical protein [Brevundimonas diminuta]MBK1970822.1 hypothetical protein [Brevundimonas diminuta]MBK1974797.1 hypothetical protein [Brevundimonas diminuta]